MINQQIHLFKAYSKAQFMASHRNKINQVMLPETVPFRPFSIWILLKAGGKWFQTSINWTAESTDAMLSAYCLNHGK